MPTTIAAKINAIQEEIKKAQSHSPFAAPAVKLLAVTKTVSPERIREAMEAGLTELGENRVQEMMGKYEALPAARWHLIGHLQTNKVKYILDKVQLIHSLDRIELAQELEKRAAAINTLIPVLVQVNIADEDSKFGLSEAETPDYLENITNFPHLQVQGLMTIGPFVPAEEIRPVFRQLRLLRDKMRKKNLPYINLDQLSMGMSNDYQVAVEEGATIVRLGSVIFGARQ
ncbi:MAG: YggS family pyridoxal phosphate-dependent enzyme [Clostridiales bacterium]|nr:YggS family pyridoxal phosphate-dependent enzyme [Clostridiales bacterium]